MKIELDNLENAPQSAEEIANFFLEWKRKERFILHLPSPNKLLKEILRDPEKFLSPGDLNEEQIKFVLLDGKPLILKTLDKRVLEKRFDSLEDAFQYLLPRYLKFISDEFYSWMKPAYFPKKLAQAEWSYSQRLVLELLSRTLQSPIPPLVVPKREQPTTQEVIALILEYQSKFIDKLISDGLHIHFKNQHYVVAEYERGNCFLECKFDDFSSAMSFYIDRTSILKQTPIPNFFTIASSQFDNYG